MREMFLIAITIFLIGSLLAGLAGDMLAPQEQAEYQGYFLMISSIVNGRVAGGIVRAARALYL